MAAVRVETARETSTRPQNASNSGTRQAAVVISFQLAKHISTNKLQPKSAPTTKPLEQAKAVLP